MNALIRTHQNKPVTTSRLVAEKFGKEHKDVLRSIRNLASSDDGFGQRNFAPTDFIDGQGKKYTEYIITRDGFTMLVMGFSGKDAMRFKIEYIEAFNEYERVVNEVQDQNAAVINHIEKLTEAISNLAIGYNARMNGFEERLNRLEARPTVPALTAQSLSEQEEKRYTITEYAKRNDVLMEVDGFQDKLGQRAYNLCLKRKLKPEKIEIEGFDRHINKYPESILRTVFSEFLWGSGKRRDLFHN